MTRHEPDVAELTRFLDGEVSENRAAAIRAHLTGCARCRDALDLQRRLLADLAAPIAVRDADLVAQLVRRLDATSRSRVPSRWLWPSCATLAAAAVLFVATRPPADVGELRARGADHRGEPAGRALARHVGLAVHSIAPERARLDDGSRVVPTTAYALSARNSYHEPIYVLAFAVDAQQTIHWLAPAHLDASQDPLASPVPRTEHEAMSAGAVVFDDIAPGRLRIMTIVSPIRQRVSAIEGLPVSELSRAALAARWRDAIVREVDVEVDEEPTSEDVRDGAHP